MNLEIEQLIDFCEALGWKSIESRNPKMISFMKEEEDRRLNVYFTTGTVSIEDKNHFMAYYRDVDLEQLEFLLTR